MDEDVLELTQMVQDDGSVVDVEDPQDDPWARAMDPEPEPEPEEPEPPLSLDTLDDLFDKPAPRRQPVSSYDDDDLVSAPTAAATSAAFAQLASSIGGNRFSGGMQAYGGGPTVEDILKDVMRPLLRDWLDQNLPPMVERMVQREIENLETGLNPSPTGRIASLRRRIQDLEHELAQVEAGHVVVLDEAQAIEGIREVYNLATSLRADFRRVEDSWREADRALRHSIISEQSHRGEIVDRLLDGQDALLNTPEGRVFESFQQQLRQSAELEAMRERTPRGIGK